MKIGDYVASGREWLNDRVRGVPYVGDVLAYEINPKEMLEVGLVGLAVGGGVGNSGCAAVVGGYVGHKLARGGKSNKIVVNIEKNEKDRGEKVEVPEGIDDWSCYKITSLKTKEIEYVEDYDAVNHPLLHWDKHVEKYDEKFSNGYRLDFIRDGIMEIVLVYNPR